jgi:hypothetical protein
MPRRAWGPALLATLSLAMLPSPAGAATIGYLPASPPATNCNGDDADYVQSANGFGATFTVPAYGATITSWSNFTGDSVGQQNLTFKVFRKVAEPRTYRAVGRDGPRPLTNGVVNTFNVNIPVQPGDLIGINSADGGTVQNSCSVSALVGTDDFDYYGPPGLAVGDEAPFTDSSGGILNVSAVVKPSNSFTFGVPFINDFKGQTRLAVNVPGPGTLALSGAKVRPFSTSVSSGPVAATLVVKPKGKLFKKLRQKGKAKAAATVTYTPTGGDPAQQNTTVKLRKKPKR